MNQLSSQQLVFLCTKLQKASHQFLVVPKKGVLHPQYDELAAVFDECTSERARCRCIFPHVYIKATLPANLEAFSMMPIYPELSKWLPTHLQTEHRAPGIFPELTLPSCLDQALH